MNGTLPNNFAFSYTVSKGETVKVGMVLAKSRKKVVCSIASRVLSPRLSHDGRLINLMLSAVLQGRNRKTSHHIIRLRLHYHHSIMYVTGFLKENKINQCHIVVSSTCSR